ncbi:MAG: peroxiredoxin family protein [Acidimicrobiales bacterium]
MSTPSQRERKTGPPPARGAKVVQARRRKGRRLATSVGVIAAVAVVGLFFLARTGGGSSGSGSGPTFAVGRPGPGADAPAIRLPATAGGAFDLGAERGKNVLLYFQEGVGCQPCWDQMRDIEKNWAQFKALGVDEFVTIAGNPVAQLRQKVADESLTMPVLADPDLTLGKSYEANKFGMMGTGAYGHSFVLVGPDGKIRWRADYGGSPNYTMYVRVPALLKDLRAGTGGAPAPS